MPPTSSVNLQFAIGSHPHLDRAVVHAERRRRLPQVVIGGEIHSYVACPIGKVESQVGSEQPVGHIEITHQRLIAVGSGVAPHLVAADVRPAKRRTPRVAAHRRRAETVRVGPIEVIGRNLNIAGLHQSCAG